MPNTPTAPLWKRLVALFYDSLLLTAILMLAVALAMAIKGGQLVPESLFFRLYLLLVCGLFFTGFWAWRGQTLGMQTWRLHLQRTDGGKLGWGRAWLRFTLAIVTVGLAGFGFIWMFFDKDKQPLYDRLAKTRLICVPKNKPLKVDV